MALDVHREDKFSAAPTPTLVLFESAQDEALVLAREVVESRQNWDVTVRSGGENPEYGKTLQSLREEVETLRTRIPDAATYPEPERVSTNLITALRARRTWKEARNQTTRLPGNWVQSWLDTFSSFLTNYSGIVEVVKGADNQFGGIAYGTLSILLCIPVNKSQHETEIEDALEQFALSFPRLQNLQCAYPERSNALKSLIASVYAEVILFARECVIYYQKSSMGRLRETIVHPPKTGIRVKISSIRKLLSEIRLESEMLLHQRIAELHDNSRKLVTQVQALQGHLNDVERDKDQQNLNQLKSVLKIDESSPHLDTKAYQRQLDYVFSDIESSSDDVHTMTLESFKSEPIVRRWMIDPTSSMIVLGGQNWESINNSTLSWLSYGSLLAIQHFRDTAIVAHYFCQTSSVATLQARVTIQDIVAALWYQIACQAPSILRCGLEDFRHAMESVGRYVIDSGKVPKPIREAFIRVLSTLGKDATVVMVLDRLDRCQPGLKPIMIWLLKLIRQAGCTLKVLVVMQFRSSRDFLPALERRKLGAEEFYYEKLDWDQEENL